MSWMWMLWMIPILIPVGIFVFILLVSTVDGADSSHTHVSAKLECHHCGLETSASQRTCSHCGAELQ